MAADRSKTSKTGDGTLGAALVGFSLNGVFPEENVSSLAIQPEELPAAIEALTAAKAKLEAEVHRINEETADDVSAWMSTATTLREDINRSKNMANDIIKQSETPDVSGKTILDAEARADFLVRELNYNRQVQQALREIKGVNSTLDLVERARDERRILDALRLLERAWTELDAISIGKSCKAMRLLDIRAFGLKSDVHDVFDHVWNVLVDVDVDHGKISVNETHPDEPMALSDAVIGLKAYKEVDQRMELLWHEVDMAIVSPRMDIRTTSLPSIEIRDNVLETAGSADKTVKSLFADLEKVFSYFAERLPPDLVQSLSSVMMPELVSRITAVWLDSAVPASLQEMDEFQDVIATAKSFCASLTRMKFTGFQELQEWVNGAPRVWLAKCRETALDTVRSRLAEGLGSPKQVERVEKQMVSRSEGKELAANSAAVPADNQDWDAAWSDGEDQAREKPGQAKPKEDTNREAEAEDDGTDAWGWGEEEEKGEEQPEEQAEGSKDADGDDDADPAEAWGWGDEDTKEEPEQDHNGSADIAHTSDAETRELTLKETYNISSMPEPVLALISAIAEDGALLTRDEYTNSPVAAAAAGLFSLPTLALAMFRAISPYYYSLDIGGNMFLYNDATYLSEKLGEFAATWKKRGDLSLKAQNMLRIDNDVKTLQSFATRAYSNEMNVQKTVLKDLLGGEQNLIQQEETESCVDAAVSRVRSMAVAWESILARSAWYQAVGALVDTVSTKIITDVMEMSSIGQDEAYNIAKLIVTVTELDDLFLPSRAQEKGIPTEGDEIPTTAQYAASWLRLKYLSEVLQSNLRDVRFLWMESELSLYFSADEVVELINLSFEDNPRTREVIKEVTQNPHPVR